MDNQTDPVLPSQPPIPSPAPIVPVKGFFSGKVLISLIVVGVLIAGIAFGYFVFPEPFYNSIGKYLGLPGPSVQTEEIVTQEPIIEEPAADETAITEEPAAETPLDTEPANINSEALAPSSDETPTETDTATEEAVTRPKVARPK